MIYFPKKQTNKILQVFQSSKLFQPHNCQSSIHNETFFAVAFLTVSFESFRLSASGMYNACISARLGLNEILVNISTRVLYGELTCGKSRSLILSLSLSLCLSVSLSLCLSLLSPLSLSLSLSHTHTLSQYLKI